MKAKSILTYLPAWLALLAFSVTTLTWSEPLFGQDEPAADEEKDDEKDDEDLDRFNVLMDE